MPTDGADFGRKRACYGRVFTMARDGASVADIADCVGRGVERDIRRDGGIPAFGPAVDLLVARSWDGNREQLLSASDAIRREYANSPLTRDIAAAVDVQGLSAIVSGRSLTREEASVLLVTSIGASRCCEDMTGYLARNRTGKFAEAKIIVACIKAELPQTTAVLDLAHRMLECSTKGLPAKAPKLAPVAHTAEGLGEEIY